MRNEQLFQRALCGDESAFVALLDVLEQPVFAYFRQRRVQPADAEDLTQEVFAILLRYGRRFDEQRGSLRAFVFGTARRVWLKHAARAGRASAAIPLDIVDDLERTPAAAAESNDVNAIVAEETASLPTSMREVLTMHIHHDMSIAEIAGVLDMPPNTVKSHLFRARNRLRESITAKLELKEGDRHAL